MVLTEEQRVGTYTAVSFEDASVSEEQVYFENVDVQRTVKPIQGTREKAQLLSKNTRSVGAGKLLKVMAGDRLHVKVDYYSPTGRVDNREANGLKSILSNLVSVLEGSAAQMVSKGQGSGLVQSLEQAGALSEFFRPQGAQTPITRPKAYLNILFFDEQLRFVGKGSEAVPVKEMGSWQQLRRLGEAAKKVPQNGYAYVYVSNESNNLVYFDNLQVSQQLGPILEETHYYPFGLTMQGISSKAMGSLENKLKFNDGTELENKEFSDGSGSDLYATEFRSYDPQIGRFHQMDPLGEAADDWSPYVFAYNNPIFFNDPLGLTPSDSTGKPAKEFINTPGTAPVLPEVIVPPPVKKITPTDPPSSSAGLPAIPLPGLYPVSTPGTPAPVIEMYPSLGSRFLPLLGRIGGTIVGVLMPTSGGLASGVPNVPMPSPFKVFKPWGGHGNDRDNSNPHIVYTFTFTPSVGDVRTPVLKYGISDESRYGLDRPEAQMASMKARFGASVKLSVLTRTLNRAQALNIEQNLVNRHQALWNEMPRAQIRPTSK